MEKILESTCIAAGPDEPYIVNRLVIEKIVRTYNPQFGDDKKCDCGHSYYRHFDTYENMETVGCKYCQCWNWHHPVKKAGLIPYKIDEQNVMRMLFMISSDPAYGGPLPQISKGNVDDTDEGSNQAALREAEEELGLRGMHQWNLFEAYHGQIDGDNGSSTFKLYGAELNAKHYLEAPHFETKEVVWMSPDEFAQSGRPEHKKLVADFVNMVKEQIAAADRPMVLDK